MAAITPTALHFGSVAYQAVEEAEIHTIVLQGISKEDLGAITKIAIFMGGESKTRPYGRIGDVTSVLGDNLYFELSRLGFQVYRWNETDTSPQSTTRTMAETGKALDAQAIVTGSVAASHKRSSGMFGVGGFKTVIQSATLKVTDVKTSNLLIMVTIDYKVGQDIGIAAESMALILQTKLEDPFGDLKEKLKEKLQKNI
ncbi:MAG: hypothetical protein JXB42_10595 [Deltaproteobacteria bacterium]|nr:hypothetical protein [Deltaproteobacteria bacterium]